MSLLKDFQMKNKEEENLSVLERAAKYRLKDELTFEKMGDFDMMIMDRRVTTNTTSLRRINSFKVLIYGGNYNGIVGYGKGRGHNGQIAMKNAKDNFKQNLIAINLDLINTLPRGLHAKFGKHEISLLSRQKFNSWGSKYFSAMIQMAGIHHCAFRVDYDKPNPYNLVYCFMKLFTKNTTPKLLAEEKGIKLFETVLSRQPASNDNNYSMY